jgi:hypothetical protein
MPCACTQQFSGVRQPCAIKRGGGFPLQCVLGVAALLSPTRFLRVSVGLWLLTALDAGCSADEARFWYHCANYYFRTNTKLRIPRYLAANYSRAASRGLFGARFCMQFEEF